MGYRWFLVSYLLPFFYIFLQWTSGEKTILNPFSLINQNNEFITNLHNLIIFILLTTLETMHKLLQSFKKEEKERKTTFKTTS